MKLLLSLQIFFLVIVTSFSQSADTLKVPGKNYKNIIQTNLLGTLGYFSLQYERALNKDWSISLIGRYSFPFKQLNQPQPITSKSYTEKFSIQAELRYYLDKNEINNNGFYFSGDVGYTYKIQYIPEHKSTAYSEKKYLWLGASAGYQLLIKKRLVLDAGIGIQYGMKGQMFQTSSAYLGWYKMQYREVYFPLTLNIGYAF